MGERWLVRAAIVHCESPDSVTVYWQSWGMFLYSIGSVMMTSVERDSCVRPRDEEVEEVCIYLTEIVVEEDIQWIEEWM